jgi:aspartyl-tRNA(Asn)/glutamyl-tRNA(Gln) amidotransferase subunit C
VSIDRAEVRRIADLAQLELDESEVAALARELQSILDHFAALDELDTSDVDPAPTHPPTAAGSRDDAVRPGLSAAEALAGAPQADEGHFRVPRVLGE